FAGRRVGVRRLSCPRRAGTGQEQERVSGAGTGREPIPPSWIPLIPLLLSVPDPPGDLQNTPRGVANNMTPFRERDISMFGLAKMVGLNPRASGGQARRPRSFRAAIEVVEDRALLSTLSAINWTSGGLQHSAVFGIGGND